ncbi:MAG: hypothetical protein Q9195_006676 [Heterodermia aff. obscurata]
MKHALIRPSQFLASQPIVQAISIYLAYLYGLVFLVLTTLPDLFTKDYHQSLSIAGLNYTSLGIGYVIGSQATSWLNDPIYLKLRKRSLPPPTKAPEPEGAQEGTEEEKAAPPLPPGRPEYRLPLLFPGSILVPAGIFWYGWSAQKHLHWLMPNIGIALFGLGIKIATQCNQAYILDTYTLHAASANAAIFFLRSLGGFSFPLFAPKMYERLGYGWGNSVVVLVAVMLGVPAPWVLWKWGPWLRERSRFAGREEGV